MLQYCATKLWPLSEKYQKANNVTLLAVTDSGNIGRLRLSQPHHRQFFSEPPMPTHNWLISDPPTFGETTYLQSDENVVHFTR